MALALPGPLVAPLALVALVAPALLLLLLLCSLRPSSGRRFSTRSGKETPGMVRGVRMVQPGSGTAGAALPKGTPVPGEPQQRADGSADHRDNPSLGDPRHSHPNSQPNSEPPARTPEFLRHRQLPAIPGNAEADPAAGAEGRIYESIRDKSWTPDEAPGDGDPPSRLEGGDPGIPEPEGLGRERSPGIPVYAWVCRMPRPWQSRENPRAPESPGEEEEEEEPPPLPERHLDVE
ncbi:uncharacterized protein LOC127481780 [Manacus candei]|uniref:uncharacterized protein LOC127481780 n=1 Tax=Manacus candei TaxID=415023 RepID=UPI00222623F3|nr:uncharacterized protein LOC127481780 [Manacus candei]